MADAKIAALTEQISKYIEHSTTESSILKKKVEELADEIHTIADQLNEAGTRQTHNAEESDKKLRRAITGITQQLTKQGESGGSNEPTRVRVSLLRPRDPPSLDQTRRLGDTDWLSRRHPRGYSVLEPRRRETSHRL